MADLDLAIRQAEDDLRRERAQDNIARHADTNADEAARERQQELSDRARRDAEILSRSPRLQDYLANPVNAAVAHDDVGILAAQEQSTSQWAAVMSGNPGALRNFVMSTAAAIATSGAPVRRQFELGQIENRQSRLVTLQRDAVQGRRILTSADRRHIRRNIDVLDDELEDTGNDYGPFILGPTARMIPLQIESFANAFNHAGAERDEAWETLYGNDRAQQEARARIESGDIGQIVRSAILAPTAWTAATGAMIGGAAEGYFGTTFNAEASNFYHTMRREGIDPTIAARYAEEYATVATGIEYASTGLALATGGLGKVAGAVFQRAIYGAGGRALTRATYAQVAREAAREIIAQAAISGAEESAQSGAQSLFAQIARNDQAGGSTQMSAAAQQIANDSQLLEDMLTDAMVSFWVGSQAGVGFAVPGTALNANIGIADVRRAQMTQEIIQSFADGAANSRLRARDRNEYARAINTITEGTPIEAAYIDAERFVGAFNQDLDAALRAADQIEGVGASALEAALTNGGQVRVPMGGLAAIADTKQFGELARHVRIGPDRMTAAEVEARMTLGVDLERAATEAVRIQGERAVAKAQEDSVYQRVLEQMEGAEAFVPEANRAVARMIARGIVAQAQRGGVAPETLLDRIGLSVEGPFGGRATDPRVEAILDRADNAAPEIPRNAIPRDRVRVATPRQIPRRVVEAQEAGEIDGLAYAKGDMLVSEDADGAQPWPVGREIFNSTYTAVGNGLYAKKATAVGYFVTDRDVTIETREGPREAKAGDVVMIGAAGEMWPMPRADFDQRYDGGDQAFEKSGIHPTALRFGSEAEVMALQALVERKASGEEIMSSALLTAVADHVDSTPYTVDLKTAMGPDFYAGREFVDPETGERIVGEAVVERLRAIYSAKAGGPVAKEKRAVIVIGYPGAGKSTFINNLAREMRAAVGDADVAKEFVPAYEQGYNTQAVHFESARLRQDAVLPFLEDGSNIIVERVGDKADSVLANLEQLKEAGYEVSLLHIKVEPNEAVRRAAARFIGGGRYIDPQYYRAIFGKVDSAFATAVADSRWAGYVEVDANGPQGTAYASDAQGLSSGWLQTAALGRSATDAANDARVVGDRGGGAGGDGFRQDGIDQAQQQGYEGSDAGEAREWTRAVAKGLPMDEDSRMARAREMGFDVSRVLYHGTGSLNSITPGFDPAFTGQGNDQLGSGYYFTTNPDTASNYTIRRLNPDMEKLGGEDSPGVLPVYVRVRRPIVLPEGASALNNLDFEITSLQAEKIIRLSPIVMDPETSPIGNWYDVWANGVTSSMIKDVARQYAGNNLISLENDFFPGVDGANAFRAALTNVLKRDGVVKRFPSGEEHVVVWDASNIRSRFAAFDPDYTDSQNLLAQGAQGQTIFQRDQRGFIKAALVRFTESRDLSTPLHEFGGHVFLETLRIIAAEPTATAQAKADWQTVLDWFGVTDAQWSQMSQLPLKQQYDALRPYHEKFARGFEVYVMEGKSPSIALRQVFGMFKRWMMSVYKEIKGIQDAPGLTPEIRAVYDRLLATDEEIAQAQIAMGAEEKMTREQFGAIGNAFADKAYERYLANIDRARAEAAEEVERRAVGVLVAEQKRWWRSEERKVRETVRLDLQAQADWTAYDWLIGRRVPDGAEAIRLSPAATREEYPASLVDSVPPELLVSDVDSLSAQARAVKQTLRAQRPKRLLEAISDLGGIKLLDSEARGDVLAILGTDKAVPVRGRMKRQLINNASGRPLDGNDGLIQALWEMGYFGAKPTGMGFAQAPDAGGGRGGQDLSDFDTDQVWTRAVKGGVDPFEVQPAPGNTMGPGLYFGSDDIVGRAARRIGDDAVVHGAYIRNGKTASYQQWRQAYERAEKGPFGARSAAETERRAVADLERQGYIGVYRRHNHDGSAEINVFRRENVVGVPQESPAPAAPDVGNAATGQPLRVSAYRSGQGDSWFSADRRTAATYGDEVRAQEIEMRNPLVVDAQGSEFYDIPAELLPPEARGAEVIRAEFPKVSEAERQRFIQQVKNALLDAPARQARIAQDYHRRGLLPLPIGTRMRGSGLRGEPTPDGWVISDYYVSPHNPQEYGYVVSRGEESFRLAVSNQGGLTSNRPDVVLGWQALLGPDGAAAMRAQWASERSARLAERQAANEARRAATPLNDNISAADKQEWDLLYPSENSTPNAPDVGSDGDVDPFSFFQDGYGERPSIDEFLTKLRADLAGDEQYSIDDEATVQAIRDAERTRDWFAERGVDIEGKPGEVKRQIEAMAPTLDFQGLDADTIASMVNGVVGARAFESGQELLEALARLPKFNEAVKQETERRLRQKFGDPFEDGSVAEQARKAAHGAAAEAKLEIELDAIERATGGQQRPVSAAAKAVAERQIERMTVKQIRNYDWFLANERRHAKAAQEALAKGDALGARQAKHRQLVNFHLYRLARAAADEMDMALRYFKRLQRLGARAAIDPDYVDQIDGLLEQYELRQISGPETQRRIALAAWVRSMEDRGLGHMVTIDPRIIDQAKRQPFDQLDLDEARALVDAVKNIEHLGRLKDRLLDAADQRAFADVVSDLTARMEATGPISKKVTANYSPTAFERTADEMRKAHAEMTRMEFLFRYLDGGANGPLWRALWLPFARAADKESAMMNQSAQRMRAIWDRYTGDERARMFKTRYTVSGLAVGPATSYTRAELISVALNLGNEGNVRALVDGFGWTSAPGAEIDYAAAKVNIVAELDKVLTQRDWETVQQIWELIGSYRDDAFALQEDLTGLRPEAVQAEPVATSYGTLPGGYYPLKFDRTRDLRVDKVEAKQEVQELYGSNWTAPMTRKGHLINRVGSGGRPVKLSLAVATEHMQNAIHDIAYRRAVVDVNRIISDSRFAESFIAVAGRPMYDQLAPWLQAIASDRVDPSAFMWKFLQKLRGNAAIAAMGYRLSTALQQLTGIVQAIPMLGAAEMAGGLVKLVGRPDRIATKARFILNRSEFMRSRVQTFDRDVRETIERMETTDPLHPIKENAFALVGMFDWAVSSVVWTTAYDKARAGKVDGIDAIDEEAAVAYADSAVRTTQSAGLPQDLPAVMRGNQVNKLLTMFFSYFSVLYNWTAFDQVMNTRKGRLPLHVFVGNMALIYVISPLIAEALAGRWEPREDEDEEARNARLAAVVARFPFQTIPVLRDMANAAGSYYEYQLSPAQSGPAQIIKALEDAAQGRTFDSEATTKRAVVAAGFAFGWPTPAAWIPADYIADKLEGEEEDGFDPMEAFVRDSR